MDLYERNISKKILLFRLFLISLLFAIAYFVKINRQDYLILLITIFIGFSFLSITYLKITIDEIFVTKYSLYGLVNKKIIFTKEALSMYSYDMELRNPETSPHSGNSSLFNPTIIKMYILKQNDANGNLRETKLRLSNEERNIILQYFVKEIEFLG